MKNLLFLFFLFLVSSLSFSQTSMPVNYQAVIRDNQGLILANENVDIRFTIIQGSPTGSSIYLEDHKVKTNQFGLVNIELGTGLVLGGDFYTIDWSLNNYYLKLELQKNNGAGFIDLGTSKFNAVPFANYALNAGNVNNSDTSASNELQIITLSNNNLELSKSGGVVDLSPFLDNTDNQTLTRTGNQITISGGNSINLPTDNVFDGDSSVFNELQAISFVNDTLTLTNGGKVYLGAYNNSQAILFNAQQITNLTALKKADSTLFVNLIQVNSNAIQNLNNQYLFLAQKAVSDSLFLQNQINTHVNQDLDLDSLNELQIMSISNDTIYLSKSGFIVLPPDEVNDGDFDNTNELQILSISNDTLSLSNGGFVVLPDNVDDADNNPTNEIQVLSISNDTLYLSSGGFAVLPDDKFEDNDADSLNEIQMLSISNDSIFLSNGGYVVLPPDDDSDSTNEIQNLSISGDTIYLSNGGSAKLPVDEVNDGDFDSNNEIQFISISGDSLKLSNGGYVDLSNYDNSAIIQGLIQKISNDSLQFQSLINSNTNNLSNLITKRVTDSTLLTQRLDTVSQNISSHILNDLDMDTLNEIQVISISNDTLYLENGGFVDMADFRDYNKLENKPDSLSDFVNDMGFLTNQNTSTYQIGDTAFGGIIYYVSPNGNRGRVVSLNDQGNGVDFHTAKTKIDDYNSVGLISDEFQDWMMPLIKDLELIWNNLGSLNFIDDVYWSKSDTIISYDHVNYFYMNFGQSVHSDLYAQFISQGQKGFTSRENRYNHSVRAIRHFGDEAILIPENLDNDSTNEIQALSISNDTISISNSNFIKLPKDSVTKYKGINGITVSNDTIGRNQINVRVSSANDTLWIDGNWIIIQGISAQNQFGPPPPVTDIDNNTYQTVKIGNQIWMAENLKASRLNNGGSIIRGRYSTGACYDIQYPNNIETYYYSGYLVNYNICPTGWHVPSKAELDTLANNASSPSLKSLNLWINSSTATTPNNSTGFNLMPLGGLYPNSMGSIPSTPVGVGSSGNFWGSSTSTSPNSLGLSNSNNNISVGISNIGIMRPIRCIKD